MTASNKHSGSIKHIDLKFVSLVHSQTNQRLHHGSDGERRATPDRLVVKTSRHGRDNPGSTPGEDTLQLREGSLDQKVMLRLTENTLQALRKRVHFG